MKKTFKTPFSSNVLYILAVAVVLASCSKSSSGGGASSHPTAMAIAPDSAAGGNVLTLTGSGLSDIRTIVFDKDSVPAPFNPVFNTDGAVIFRVPDTAFGGPQNIIFINSIGASVSVPFNVIALPTISAVSNTDFTVGTNITLTGNNLDNVTSVTLTGTSDVATIVSQTHKVLVISMPSTTVTSTKLDITNASGKITTSQTFVSVDNNFGFFKDDFGPGVNNWSWATVSASTDVAWIGTSSLKAVYGAGGWQAISLHEDPTIDVSQYTYLTFYVKGGTQDNQLDVQSENGGTTNTITIPATVWTYFKFPVSGFLTGFPLERLDFKMHGPDNSDQTVYFDDILLVK